MNDAGTRTLNLTWFLRNLGSICTRPSNRIDQSSSIPDRKTVPDATGKEADPGGRAGERRNANGEGFP